MYLSLNEGILGVSEDLTSSLHSALLYYQTLAFFHNVCETTCLVKGGGSVILHTYIRRALLCSWK